MKSKKHITRFQRTVPKNIRYRSRREEWGHSEEMPSQSYGFYCSDETPRPKTKSGRKGLTWLKVMVGHPELLGDVLEQALGSTMDEGCTCLLPRSHSATFKFRLLCLGMGWASSINHQDHTPQTGQAGGANSLTPQFPLPSLVGHKD